MSNPEPAASPDLHQLVLDRQEPLRTRYREQPGEALIRDHAETRGGARLDPFRARLICGEESTEREVGLHRAVGGYHDRQNPGDLLCGALASCFDTTLRLLAARLGVPLTEVAVEVSGEVDVRGTLAVDRDVPVGFLQMHCRVRLRAAEGATAEQVARLAAAAERACVVMQTLRRGVGVSLALDDEDASHTAMRKLTGDPGGVRS